MTPEEFVKIWQSSKSREEVIRRTRLTGTACSSRAKRYRIKLAEYGVTLKRFKDNGSVDWQTLAKLVKDDPKQAEENMCKCCGNFTAISEDKHERCQECVKDNMVPSRRGWRQLGVYDG